MFHNNAAFPNVDIIDTQVHVGPGGIDETLAKMDALGIKRMVIDECWVEDLLAKGEFQPTVKIGDCTRNLAPTAQLAAKLHPDRFAYLLRIAFNDPEAAALMRITAADPGCKAFRVDPGLSPLLVQAYAAGCYDHIYEVAGELDMPVCTYLPDNPEVIERVIAKFPQTKFVIDHCGIYDNFVRGSHGMDALSPEDILALFDRILALAKYPNVYLKWSHVSENFNIAAYPGTELQPILRRAIDAFGANRIMWATDFSVNQRGENWAELLFCTLGNTDLSEEELIAIMGGTAKAVFNWE